MLNSKKVFRQQMHNQPAEQQENQQQNVNIESSEIKLATSQKTARKPIEMVAKSRYSYFSHAKTRRTAASKA
jgi:hypothetical protein